MYNRCSSCCITSFTQGSSSHFLTDTCFYIVVNVLEAILQYELVSADGEVVFRNRYDRVCISSPDLCSLPAGGKSPKESENKQKTKQQQQRIKTGREKKTGRGLGETFAHMGLLTFSNISKAYRVLRSTDRNYRFCSLKIPT